MKFSLRDEDMFNSTKTPINDGFFAYGPNGLLNVSRRAGFPFFVSKPHFLDADPWLREAIDGLSPDPNIHGTVIYKSDMMGTTIAANETVQLNAFIANLKFEGLTCLLGSLQILPCCTWEQTRQWDWKWNLNVSQSENKDGIYLPIVYVREAFKIPEAIAEQMKTASTMYYTVPRYAPLIGFPVVGVCIIGLVVLIVQRIRMLKKLYWKIGITQKT